MIKAVIFDMDGVLFDTERVAVQSWEKSGNELGYPGMGNLVQHCLGLSKKRSKKVFEKLVGADFPYEEFSHRASELSREYFRCRGVPVKAGVPAALSYLKEHGYLIAVATSTSRKSAMRNFDTTGLTGYFDAIVCGDEIENGKPAPDIYLAAARKLNAAPESCLAVEDSPNGIRSVAAAGMTPVMVPDLVQPDAELEKLFAYCIGSLEQLPELCERINV